MTDWRLIETAPKGGGAELVTNPDYVDPPEILLFFWGGERRIGKWDWYYAEGGGGFHESKGHAWVEPTSGELLVLYYGPPTHWMPLPEPPVTP